MKFRNTLILLGILAALAAYVYFAEMRKGEQPTEEGSAVAIFNLNSEDVVELTVRRVQNEVEKVTRVRREEGQPWQIEEPIQEPAYDTQVTNLVKRLATLQAARQLEKEPSDSDLAVYGLKEPQLTFTMQMKDGSKHILLVGDKNPTKTGYYAQRRGDPAIYLIYTALVYDLDKWIDEPPKIPTPTPTVTETPAGTLTPTMTVFPTGTQTPTATPAP